MSTIPSHRHGYFIRLGQLNISIIVPQARLELARPKTAGLKPTAPTDYATGACVRTYGQLLYSVSMSAYTDMSPDGDNNGMSPMGVFPCCPICDGPLYPEHAHYRCKDCGWRDSCCD